MTTDIHWNSEHCRKEHCRKIKNTLKSNLKSDSDYSEVKITRNNVGAECRHNTRPSVQLPSVSGANSKWPNCITAIWSATYFCSKTGHRAGHINRICSNFLRFFYIGWLWPLNFSTENWCSTYSCAKDVCTNFKFPTFFVFELQAHTGHKQMDR